MKQEEFRKIISMAIDREVESYTFYHTVSEKVKDNNLKNLFMELAGQEKQHRELLQSHLGASAKPLHFDETRDYKVSTTFDTPPLTVELKPLDGLKIAIKKEEEAMTLYTDLANASSDGDQKAMFLELAKMERSHKARLEDIYTNMAFPEAW